jgi:hypothetical protein
METTHVDLSHMSHEDLMNLRRHLRAMLLIVEQMLRFHLTSQSISDKR